MEISDRYKEIIDNEWLGIGDTTAISTINPFLKKTEFEIENPHLYYLNFMRDPNNFYFTCKHILNKTVPPLQLAILHELWYRPFPMLIGTRGMGKSFLLGLYAILRSLLCQGVKIVIVGAAFRQSKVVFEYMEEIWNNAPVLRDICSESSKNGPKRDVDRWVFRIGDSTCTALPLGTGTKIRGQRANITIAEEVASIMANSREIFENVVAGFSSVALNPIDKMREASRRRAMKRLGLLAESKEKKVSVPGVDTNQTILSGTAYYSFNDFYLYWRRYKAIVESRGEPRKVAEIFDGEIPDKFDWRDYSVIRLPFHLLPESYMDEKNIAKAKATQHTMHFQLEYSCCFSGDSNGFFRRSLVEACVVGKRTNPISKPSCGEVTFNAVLRGELSRRYVMAIDPAADRDNFAITILELWPDHRRLVYCWTTNKKNYREKAKVGLTTAPTFYAYCARKIRELMKLFPCEKIAFDAMGGGKEICEALNDENNMVPGDDKLWPSIDPEKDQDTDDNPGLHLIELIQFAKSEWTSGANHSLKKDFEDKVLLFPEFDSAVLGLAGEEDTEKGRRGQTNSESIYDSLEACVLDIEELKDELASIQHTQTSVSGREHWDTPEIKEPGGKKGRLRKDRYSALLMANAVARVLMRTPAHQELQVYGGFAHSIHQSKKKDKRGNLPLPAYSGPQWFTKDANKLVNVYKSVKKKGS